MPAVFVLLVLASLPPVVRAQTAPGLSRDPYRNFVGHWSGTIPVSSTKMPSTLTLDAVEEDHGKKMRFDYMFGVKGQKGFERSTKWIVLKPAEELMVSHWKRKLDVNFRTAGLKEFSEVGYGAFAGGTISTGYPAYSKITYELHPDTLTYVWETSPDKVNFTIYSRFELKRDTAPVAP